MRNPFPSLTQDEENTEGETIRLVCLGDTHERHREVRVPDGDILIHAGDFTNLSRSFEAIEDFDDWLAGLPHAHKIVVPGNHEFFLEADESRRSLLTNARVLINEGVELLGLRLWGSPTTPLYGAAFGKSSSVERTKLWKTIPDRLDVLVTHGPPYGILDQAVRGQQHLGDPELRAAVAKSRPRVHIFGHVHGAHGEHRGDRTTFFNVALMNQHQQVVDTPKTFLL